MNSLCDIGINFKDKHWGSEKRSDIRQKEDVIGGAIHTAGAIVMEPRFIAVAIVIGGAGQLILYLMRLRSDEAISHLL
jgi:hypothetical protein